MRHDLNSPVLRLVRFMLAAITLAGVSQASHAGGIPFAGNRPESFEFSTKFTDSYDSFGQFIQYNDDAKAFNNAGDKVGSSGGNTFVGLSSRLHYFKIGALPDWGFLASITVPEVRVQAHQSSASGIGDPLLGGLAFTNPAPGTTVGVQAYVQAPIGSERVTTDTWSLWPSLFFNHWAGPVNVDLLVGGILRGTTHKSGVPDVDGGNTYHANLRIGYSLTPSSLFAIPFISLDTQHTGFAKSGGVNIAQSDSRETALGLGVLFQLKPGSSSLWRDQKTYDQFSIHYSRGISGKNTSVTNGLFAQYWHYW